MACHWAASAPITFSICLGGDNERMLVCLWFELLRIIRWGVGEEGEGGRGGGRGRNRARARRGALALHLKKKQGSIKSLKPLAMYIT